MKSWETDVGDTGLTLTGDSLSISAAEEIINEVMSNGSDKASEDSGVMSQKSEQSRDTISPSLHGSTANLSQSVPDSSRLRSDDENNNALADSETETQSDTQVTTIVSEKVIDHNCLFHVVMVSKRISIGEQYTCY